MTPTTLAGYISAWLRPMTQEQRQQVLSDILDDFCPACGRESQPGLDGVKRRCQCWNDE